jgi:hypothetical protein
MYAAKMAPIRKTEKTLVQLENHVEVDSRAVRVLDFGHFFRTGEPKQTAVQLEVERDDALRKLEPEIFASSLD